MSPGDGPDAPRPLLDRQPDLRADLIDAAQALALLGCRLAHDDLFLTAMDFSRTLRLPRSAAEADARLAALLGVLHDIVRTRIDTAPSPPVADVAPRGSHRASGPPTLRGPLVVPDGVS